MKVHSFYDENWKPQREIVPEKTDTIPDLALSVRDIIERFSRGQIEIPKTESGNDEDIDSIDFTKEMDIVDYHELVKTNVDSVNKRIRTATERRAKGANSPSDVAEQSDSDAKPQSDNSLIE